MSFEPRSEFERVQGAWSTQNEVWTAVTAYVRARSAELVNQGMDPRASNEQRAEAAARHAELAYLLAAPDERRKRMLHAEQTTDQPGIRSY